MKKMLLLILCTMVMLCWLQAQNAETHVTVYAGGAPLETLLTEAQKQSVTYLEITGGTLSDKDYVFLRDSLLEQLDTLDLRHAEIDTIPADALGEMNLYLILPEVIECIGDYAFTGECEVTGNFPYMGKYKNSPYDKPLMQASKDHPKLVDVEELCYFAVYSKDGNTLYYLKPKEYVYWGEDVIIQTGTRVIAPTAIRNMDFPIEIINLVLPESIDSIGDYALDIRPNFMTGYSRNRRYPSGGYYGYGSVICEAKDPPKLGELGENFWVARSNLYVPKASLEAYKDAPGWNLAREILSIEKLLGVDVPSLRKKDETAISVTSTTESYILTLSKKPLQMNLLNVDGRVFDVQTVYSTKIMLSKKLLQNPMTLIQIRFADGTTETVKLIP